MTAFFLRAMPERGKFIREIRRQVPDVVLVFDRVRSARETFRDALRAAGEAPAVHMEDDILLAPRFLEQIEAEIADRPASVIQFFSRTEKDDKLIGSRWRAGGTFSMNQCFYLPAGMGPALLDFSLRWPGNAVHRSGNDLLMADFFREADVQYWQRVPSLVQHAEAVSLIDRRRSSRRQSPTFEGEA